MAKEKIVRCRVSKSKGEGQPESVRYVPLEIYDLWKHLMAETHSFAVEEDYCSLWFDIDGDPNVTYADSNYEKVVRICLWVYSDEDGMFRKITRYFPADGYDTIKPQFLAHYSVFFDEPRFAPRIEEMRGVWLRREE